LAEGNIPKRAAKNNSTIKDTSFKYIKQNEKINSFTKHDKTRDSNLEKKHGR